MIYQKLLIGEKPYYLSVGTILPFGEHRHPEAEFIYCLTGSFGIAIDRNKYTVSQGNLALISPMAVHEITDDHENSATALVIEVGPVLLGSHFAPVAKATYRDPVRGLNGDDERYNRLRELLLESAEIFKTRDAYSELMIRGNVYKICACLLDLASDEADVIRDIRAVANIEKAIELIHNRYNEPLTVELVASVTGYSKSNFCKIFKNIVGDTFHNVLNRHRVENACCFLEETFLPVSEIAPLVGFSDAKSFCRVFKNIKGISPGQYRQGKRR